MSGEPDQKVNATTGVAWWARSHSPGPAFWLGGRDVAAQITERWYRSTQQTAARVGRQVEEDQPRERPVSGGLGRPADAPRAVGGRWALRAGGIVGP